MKNVKAGLFYFALVFGAGFVLGTVRTLWAVPRFGVRTAELLEMPLMLLISIASARWVIRHLAVPVAATSRLMMGGMALALLLVAEFGFVLYLRGLSLSEYFASRDTVSGTVYYLMLGLFAIFPLLLERKKYVQAQT